VADYDLGFLVDESNPPDTKFSHYQYYAPELFSDSFVASPDVEKKAADVWAAGMLLYTLFTYKEPFPNADVRKRNVTDSEVLKISFSLNSKNIEKPFYVLLQTLTKGSFDFPRDY